MAVLPRASDDVDAAAPGSGGQITSSRIATSTVIGMVLGILCLFTMVISYQLMSTPCKRRGKAAKRPPLLYTTHTPSKSTRSFTSLKHFFRRGRQRKQAPALGEKLSFGTSESASSPRGAKVRSLYLASTKPFRSAFHRAEKEKPSPDDTSRTPNLRERRALRSLYLNTRAPSTPTTKRYPCNPSPSPTTPTRKRMAGLLHLNSGGSPDSPDTLTPFSPRSAKSRRLYQKLDDTAYSDWSNEESYQTERPVSALISPWSPSEYEFPYPSFHSPLFSAGEPMTPPPLYPPPPAYLPEVPLRSPASAPATPTRRPQMAEVRRASSPVPVPVSPIVSTLTEEIASDIDTWTALRQGPPPGILTHGPEHRADGVFVIANDDSEDETSNRDSISTLGTVASAGTWETFDV